MAPASAFKVIADAVGCGVDVEPSITTLPDERQMAVVFERIEDNPFLPKFYQSRELYAFQNQTFFLLNRYQQQMELAQQK